MNFVETWFSPWNLQISLYITSESDLESSVLDLITLNSNFWGQGMCLPEHVHLSYVENTVKPKRSVWSPRPRVQLHVVHMQALYRSSEAWTHIQCQMKQQNAKVFVKWLSDYFLLCSVWMNRIHNDKEYVLFLNYENKSQSFL